LDYNLSDKTVVKPKISFIVTARNDNYGGDFLQRTQSFIDILLYMCEKHTLDAELVIVEWNPPKENPPLIEALKWPAIHKHTQIRIIRVSEELHRTFPRSDMLQVLEFIAKNVGVRRAQGEFILVTNPDIIFPSQLVEFLGKTDLSKNHFYRSTRYDVAPPPTQDLTPDEYLSYCKSHVTRINGILGSFYNGLSSRLDFRRILLNLFGYFVWRIKFFPLDMPFTNASGDFHLMHRDHWHTLHGYAEIVGTDKYGYLHIDAFMVYEAMFLGLKQVRLNNHLNIYHLEHGRPRILNMEIQAVDETRNKLLKARKPVIINDDTWGLGEYSLPEETIR
jgi:hypothetical protein